MELGPTGSDGTIPRILVRASDGCALDCSAPEAGARVYIYPWHALANQQWIYNQSDKSLKVVSTKMALTVVGGVPDLGARISVYPAGSPLQDWVFVNR